MLPTIIETTRLRLRPFRLRDVDEVFGDAADPEWARYLPVPQPYTQTDAAKFIAGQVLRDHEVHPAWAIDHAGAIIGGIHLPLHCDHHIGEMGYSIARRYWGQGLATEAARAVMEAAFTVYASLNRIRAMADARNLGSLRVMAKLGMVREGVLRQNRLVRGEYIDEVWCGVLRREWEAHRQRGKNCVYTVQPGAAADSSTRRCGLALICLTLQPIMSKRLINLTCGVSVASIIISL